MHFMTLRGRTIPSKRAFESIFVGLLALSLVLFVAGCGAVGSGDDDDGDGGGGGEDGPEDTTAPAAPSGLSGASQDGAVGLTWSAVGADDLDGYNVYRASSSIDDVADLSPQNGELLTETSFVDESAENGTTYHYAVTAVDTASNESGPSGAVEKTPFFSPSART
jgi:TolB protein